MYCICINQCLTSCSGCFLLVTLSFSVIPVFQGLNFWCFLFCFFFCGFFFSLKTKKTKLILHLFYCHILIRDKHYNLNKEGSCSNRFICKIYPSFFSSVFSYHLRFVQQFRENRQSLVKTKSSTCRKPHAPHK